MQVIWFWENLLRNVWVYIETFADKWLSNYYLKTQENWEIIGVFSQEISNKQTFQMLVYQKI